MAASDFSGIKLATVKTLTSHRDDRGTVRETYRESWFPMVPPVKQLVRSESKPRVLRGMHLHRRQWDIWHFVEGAATVRLYDPATGANELLTVEQDHVIAIPPGIAHGFYTDKGCVLMYALTEEYDGSDEAGFYPFDGLNGSPGWWVEGLLVSPRDQTAPRLADFKG